MERQTLLMRMDAGWQTLMEVRREGSGVTTAAAAEKTATNAAAIR